MASVKILKDRIVAILRNYDWQKDGTERKCMVGSRTFLYYTKNNEITFNNPNSGDDITIKLTQTEADSFLASIRAIKDQNQKTFIENVLLEIGGSIE
jgi:hypothetical protein